MSTIALLQDPYGKGGVATAVRWYRSWMQRHNPDYRELYLDESCPGGLRRLSGWTGESPGIPRVLPKLQVPPYSYAARRVRKTLTAAPEDVHVVGASIAHGALLPGPKAVVWVATLFEDERVRSMQLRSPSRRFVYAATLPLLGRLEARVLMEAQRVLAMSHHTADLIIQRHLARSEAVSVVPVPVDTANYCLPCEGAERRGALFVGRAHDPRKGFTRLVDLARASHSLTCRGISVVSPGRRPPSLPPAINWLGPVTDLPAVYQRHEVLVVPSRQEGLGIVVFEALACGTPVVAWECGGPDRFLRESGGGVLVSTASELRAAVEELLGDSALQQQMGAAGRRYVEQRFSAERFLEDCSIFT